MQTLNSFSEISRNNWQAFLATLPEASYPFLQYDFLALIEAHAATPATGWQAKHLALLEDDTVRGFMPLYAKQHSFGEFVFDQSWAQAYQQQGLNYYPKLLNAIPFTPCPGPRVLGDHQAKRLLLQQATALCKEQGYSGIHSLFVNAADKIVLNKAEFLPRHDCVYRWQNQDFSCFDDYLMALRRDKRKKIRQERRKIAASDIQIQWLCGDQIEDVLWPQLYRLYCNSYWIRGQQPYLPEAFFRQIATAMPKQFLICLASHNQQPIAAAYYYRDAQRLYGRHWGADADYHSLHFELCYYQGIDYCIANGLAEFDAGVQGQHKHARGFEATQTTSMHWIADDNFRSAIANFLQRESTYVDEFIQEQAQHSAVKPSL